MVEDVLNKTLDSLKLETDPNKLVAFDIHYDDMSGQIVFCHSFALHPNAFGYDKQLEQDIQGAFKHPNTVVRTTSNMTQFVCRIKTIPKPLKKLFFKTTRHSIRITPEITMQMLKDNGLDYKNIVNELVEKHPLYVRHR